MNPFVLAAAHLRRSALGAAALVIVVAVAVAIGVAVLAQERALRQGSARAADPFDIVVGAPGSPTQLVLTTVYLQEAALPLLPPATLADLERYKGVSWMAPVAFGDSWRGHPVIGTTAALVTLGGARPLAEGRAFKAEGEAVVGADVPLALGESLTPSHGHSSSDRAGQAHEGHVLTIVGRLPRGGTPFDRAIMVPIEAVWEIHGLPTGHPEGESRIGPPWTEATGATPAIIIKAASVADAYRLRGQNRTPERMAVFPAEVLVELYRTLGDIRDIMAAITLATQALVLIAILVAVMAVVAARRREIAVLRALGAPRSFIFATLWCGLGVLLLTGGLLGVVLGYAATAAMSAWLGLHTGVRLPVAFAAEDLGRAALVVTVGLALALVPAIAAFRAPVSAGLRGG